MYFKGFNVSLILRRQNNKRPDGVNYQVVARFFLLSSSKRRILLIRRGVFSRVAFIGNFASFCGIRSRAAFDRINTVM